MILSKQLPVLILASSIVFLYVQKTPKIFALCMEVRWNLLEYCRGAGSPYYHLPDWYNQPLGALYGMAILAAFIGVMLAMIFFIKHKQNEENFSNNI